jgi:aminopeptidase N
MAAVELRADTKLGWFFDQWLRRPGWASLTTSWRYDAASKHVMLDVEQGTRFAPYRLQLAIDVTDATGRVQRVHVEIPAAKTANIVLPVDFATVPRALLFDPDVELLAEIRAR